MSDHASEPSVIARLIVAYQAALVEAAAALRDPAIRTEKGFARGDDRLAADIVSESLNDRGARQSSDRP